MSASEDLSFVPRAPFSRGLLIRPAFRVLDPEKIRPMIYRAIESGKIVPGEDAPPIPKERIDYDECRRIMADAIRSGKATHGRKETQEELAAARKEGRRPVRNKPAPPPKPKKERFCKSCATSLGFGVRFIYCPPCKQEAILRQKSKPWKGGKKAKCLHLVGVGKVLAQWETDRAKKSP